MNLMLTNFTETNYEEALMNMFSFDCDMSGENGLEYVDEEAVELGFKSNLEYFLHEAKKDSDNFKDIVSKFIHEFYTHPDNESYYYMDYKTEDLGSAYMVAFSCLTKD